MQNLTNASLKILTFKTEKSESLDQLLKGYGQKKAG